MNNYKPILLGAVAYDPEVLTIWEGIRDHFHEQGALLDFALFSNYERQIEELLKGHIDIAWNTPLAHVRVRSEEHTSELQSRQYLVCRLLLEKKKTAYSNS